MATLLNKERPPVFCPGCSHERVAKSIDKAFAILNLKGEEIAMVSDIGCSGLFDVFFNTHAMHGLHGRALTYATGIKMANPRVNVIAIMGDGGLGIGGAHFLAACRRNLNLTLVILNNFNFGMTGGQFSPTTPFNAKVSSGFLNQLEKSMDVCEVARAAGAPYVLRCSSYDRKLPEKIASAISYNGMSVMDIHGICPGRYTKRNKLSTKIIDENISKLSPEKGEVRKNTREEYGVSYAKTAETFKARFLDKSISVQFEPVQEGRHEIMILGSAGQRIVTAGEILCRAGLTAGLLANQKNDYPITVLRGHSVSDLVLSTQEIGYTGIDNPDVVIAVSEDGIKRRLSIFKNLTESKLVIVDESLNIPECKAIIKTVNFKANNIKFQDKAMVCLAVLASMRKVINMKMLVKAIETRFGEGPSRDSMIQLTEKVKEIIRPNPQQ